jgi:hypothetical protein
LVAAAVVDPAAVRSVEAGLDIAVVEVVVAGVLDTPPEFVAAVGPAAFAVAASELVVAISCSSFQY